MRIIQLISVSFKRLLKARTRKDARFYKYTCKARGTCKDRPSFLLSFVGFPFLSLSLRFQYSGIVWSAAAEYPTDDKPYGYCQLVRVTFSIFSSNHVACRFLSIIYIILV